ncbi:dehydrogenase [Thermocrinis sp.]|uniref:dehydrogenase n=1 Tax=Thermocrinis sp. TaxID=2024383 RepID=UPI002FDE9AF5
MTPPTIPLTVKPFDEQVVSLCAGCGCGCGYVLYREKGSIADLYGHPADPKGMGSLCSKGITYIQEITNNPLRLTGFYLNEKEPIALSEFEAFDLAKQKLKGKIAIILDRHLSSLEEYLLARLIGDVFVDAPVLDFKPSNVFYNMWQDYKLIIAWEAEPVFSEVMSMRYIVDAVEKGSHLVCISSRYSTVCSKAKTKLLMDPFQQISFMKKITQPEHEDPIATALKKKLHLFRGLLLINTNLLSSTFRNSLLNVLTDLVKHYNIDYSFVGDLMSFPAMELEKFVEDFEKYDSFVFFGNPLIYIPEEIRQRIKNRFSIHFTLFPNLTSQYSTLVVGASNYTERDFIAYRNSFGRIYFCPQSVQKPKGVVVPYEFLSKLFDLEVKIEEFIKLDTSLEGTRVELPSIEGRSFEEKQLPKGVVLHTANSLVEELGHWNPWTHSMEKYQKAYMSKRTAESLGLREDKITIRGKEFEVIISPNIADGVVFIPSSFEEFQPFDPGHSVGSFCKHPFYRYEVLE